MAPSLHDALRGAQSEPPARRAAGPRVLVVGGAGALGSVVLEQLLGDRHFAQVSVLVTQPLQMALRGLHTVLWGHPVDAAPALDRTALVVFDRERSANGREQAFFRPQPEQLPEIAAWLKVRGVRHLLVVMPHTQATLPDALKRGLASLDEQAVAALGFDHLVFMRSAQPPAAHRHAHLAQRLAHWMLSQLQLMVPQRERPVQVRKLAQFAAQLAAQLPASVPGTRVVPPERVWDAAQARDAGPAARAWLQEFSDPTTPETRPPPSRP